MYVCAYVCCVYCGSMYIWFVWFVCITDLCVYVCICICVWVVYEYPMCVYVCLFVCIVLCGLYISHVFLLCVFVCVYCVYSMFLWGCMCFCVCMSVFVCVPLCNYELDLNSLIFPFNSKVYNIAGQDSIQKMLFMYNDEKRLQNMNKNKLMVLWIIFTLDKVHKKMVRWKWGNSQ